MAARRFLPLAVILAALATPVLAQEGNAPPPPAVNVAVPLEAEVTDHATFTGRFRAIEQVTIQAHVSGYLSEIHFVDGQMVSAGDLLFVIDPQPFEAAIAQARANVANAQASAELAKLELERGEELVGSGAISRENVDTRQATYESAAAAVAAARAALTSAEVDLSYTRIIAPVTGRISAAEIDIGNLVTAGSSVLTSIVSVDPIHFVFDVSEGDYLAYTEAFGTSLQATGELGEVPVTVSLMGENGAGRRGVIDFVDNAFDTATGTIRLRAVVDNSDGRLVPGLFGKLSMPSSRPYQALLIPDRAVMADQSNRMVMVVDKDDTVAPRTVELGPLFDGLRVVISGLKPGERIITDGLLLARPGQKVTPTEIPLSLDGEG